MISLWEVVTSTSAFPGIYPDRPYHNNQHIKEMLGFVEKFDLEPGVRGEGVIRNAITFHDYVYDAKSTTNEEDSVAAFLKKQKIRVPLYNERVSALIMATKDHKPTDDPLSPILLDADMFILAAPEARYAEYSAGVREEYAHLTDEQWTKGRGTFLAGLLLKPRIFLIDEIEDKFGADARRNIANELKQLGESWNE